MKRILESYGPEDFEISENFVVASFKYNEHALAVMNEEKGSGKVRERFASLSATKIHMLEMISENNTITTDEMAKAIGLSARTTEKNIKQLRDAGILERKNGRRDGYWEIIER